MSERSGGRKQSKQSGASERVSGASEQANRQASGPVLTSLFWFVPDHSGMYGQPQERKEQRTTSYFWRESKKEGRRGDGENAVYMQLVGGGFCRGNSREFCCGG